eukprot:TRINITY_DN2778_c0_g1_i4.p1 TRINITY_DN2778_c0_g1~~TRINITY_DN2778_c0_g1_i4.p1  ORF type:complete len:327 (-),score=57.16 TRINITY_DN2778_c0_g1_i4:187-1101(-)
MDATRALLDELMGKDRNLLPNEKPKRTVHFTDPDVCKHYLVAFCPNDLFINTKSDLGPCTKLHDPVCKDEYQQARDRERYRYEEDFLAYLERLISDLDKRIRRGHERLDHQDDLPEVPLSEENRLRVEKINEQIVDLLGKIQTLGEEGNIDEAEALTRQVESLKNEREDLKKGGEARSISQQEKRMKVCDVCGAFLVIGDTDKRTLGHMDGKQHQGYAKIREALEEFKKKRNERRGSDRSRDDDRGSRRRRSRSRDRDPLDPREDRHRDRDRDYRDRDRDHRHHDSRSSHNRDRDRDRRGRDRR